MNAYTTTGQARIKQRDLATILRTGTGSYMAALSLAALERERGWQADAEVDWLLRQTRVEPDASASRVSLLRQTMGAVLVRAGERLASVPDSGDAPEPAPVAGTLGTAA